MKQLLVVRHEYGPSSDRVEAHVPSRVAFTMADRLQEARVLVALGELRDAEVLLADVLDEAPDDRSALSLFAKIKHMRGELSQAVACWAQLHARSPHSELALMQLGAILHLAQNPERGAEEFLALGQFQLVRKPTAQVELEEAFGLFLARRPDAARARCDQLAKKHRGKDRELFKLAVMANAWIAEMCGEIDAACTVLERLGHERGFELDTDRLLGLVRCYERKGTEEKLRAAVNLCEHMLERFEKISLLGRLATLHRRLGDEARARSFEERYLVEFERRMHRPSADDFVEVAARRHLALDRLRNLELGPFEVDEDRKPRERAIVAALSNDFSTARSLFARGEQAIDREYLGDLSMIEGRVDEAIGHYIEALKLDRANVNVIERLLELVEHASVSSGTRNALRSVMAREDVGEQAHCALESAIRSSPLRPSLWRARARLFALASHSTPEATRADDRAQALAEAARRDASPIGRVLAAGVYHFVGKNKGLMHQVWAHREATERGRGGVLLADQILGNLTSEMLKSVRNTFLAVREFALAKFPHLTRDLFDFNYSYKVTKDDEPSGGLSAGLPNALAFLSVFLQRSIPQSIASSGVVIAEAHDVLAVRNVGDAEYKVLGACDCNVQMLILPSANRAALLESSRVPPAITEEIVRYASNLDDAVRLVFGEDIFV